MNFLNNNHGPKDEATQYATAPYFCHVFIENMADLHQLSFLLTADHNKAEECFVAGLDDCLNTNHVFREWAHAWAKRTIIQNAISGLQPHPGHASSSPAGRSESWQTTSLGDLEFYRVLALEDFERFVFVMSFLEHYSEHDCALLLGCSLQDIRKGRVRALEQLAFTSHRLSDSTPELQETNR